MLKIFTFIFSLTFCSVFFCNELYAQSSTNHNDPLYWKNRKPYTHYWQQDVVYNIDAYIDEQTHEIRATQELLYTNNSPDTLFHVYFHLFQNAFVKDAYTRKLEKANRIKPFLGKKEAAGLGTTIDNLTVNGETVETTIDNTILKIKLTKPLLPNSSLTIKMRFNTYYDRGSTRRRMQMYPAWGFMHYNGCQWFPKIAVYDAKFGWDTHQHLGKEFYGNFGTYNVSLNFPSNYIVEATGMLQNRSTVLPDSLRALLDIKNFKDKPWNEPPSTIIPYKKGERKTWIFKADLVHDFAFTADPSYRIGTTYWNGVECVGLAQEPHASGWQNAASYVAKIIETFSTHYGQYHYPKMIAADANDGMEYPMLTLDGGRDPGYRGLLVHEIAHNWYYGMVGSNETYRAALDEGFTQFLTAEGLIKIDGDTLVEEPAALKWKRKFAEKKLSKDVRVYNTYILDATMGTDAALNTHSDDFGSALGHGGGYRSVYYKTATMLYNLQYVLGDSLFNKAMVHYFNQWKFAHPYFEDFRNSIIQYTKVDLNWFFDQWLETTKTIDYSVERIQRIKSSDSFNIKFKRKGSMQMPIDFTVIDGADNKHSFYIPNTWFEKQTNATILPRWIGWGKLNNTYTAVVQIPDGIKSVIIDTTYRLADKMMLNNSKSPFPRINSRIIQLNFDAGLSPTMDWKKYRLYWRPDIWYNALDGIKIGAHIEGNYLRNFMNLDASAWLNTQVGEWRTYKPTPQINGIQKWMNYRISLETPLSLNYPQVVGNFHSRFVDGLWLHQWGLGWNINTNNNIRASFQTQYRHRGYEAYLFNPMEWSSNSNRKNSFLQLNYLHRYQYTKGLGTLDIAIRTPLLSQHYNYSYIALTQINLHRIDKLLIRTRLYFRYGTGQQIPTESALYLAGANPEEQMENKFARSVGFFPENWTSYNNHNIHFNMGGGLGLRGFSGYYLQEGLQPIQYAYKGRSGGSYNIELDITRYIKWRPKILSSWLSANLYAFSDGGIIEKSYHSNNQLLQASTSLSSFLWNAGVGTTITIKKWGPLEKVPSWTLRIDAPFYVNKPNQNSPFAARWSIGVNKWF
jgi:hypothetical protein